MPLDYKQYMNKRTEESTDGSKKRKLTKEYTEQIAPKLGLLKGLLDAAGATLKQANPPDVQRIKDFAAMAEAVGVINSTSYHFENTWNSSLQTFGTLRDFLENDNGRNFDLLEETLKANPALTANLSPAERKKPMLERYRDLSNYFELGYYRDYRRRTNLALRERFLAQRSQINDFQDTQGKQIDYIAAVFNKLADELSSMPNYQYLQETRILRNMAADLTALKVTEIEDPVKQLDEHLEGLQKLPELLDQNKGEIAQKLADIAVADAALKTPVLQKLLPQRNPYQKVGVLWQLTSLFPFLSLNPSKELDAHANDENMSLEEERNKKEQAAEEEARQQELVEEQKELEEIARYERLEATARKAPEEKRKQDEERQAKNIQKQEEVRRQKGPFALPDEYTNLDAVGMVLHSAKQNGPQYQALVKLRDKLKTSVEQWESYFKPGNTFDQRLAAELANLPENASEEVSGAAVENALSAVSPEQQEQFLTSRLQGDYDARLEAEQTRLGPNATPEQAMASLYREELTESFREPLRRNRYNRDEINANRQRAALALAAEKRNKMEPAARQSYEKDKAQIRNDVIARRIRNRLTELSQDEDFRKRFIFDQMPTQKDRENYFLAHTKENDLINGYNSDDLSKQEIALFNSRMNELLNEALYDRAKWKQMNQLFEKLGAPASMKTADSKAQMDHILNSVQDETLDAEAENDALDKLSKTLPDWEIERRARRGLDLGKSDQQLLYNWVREQKTDQVRKAVEQEQRQTLPEIATLGINKASAMLRDLNKIVVACGFVLPSDRDNEPLNFDYLQALNQNEKLNAENRQKLRQAYHAYQDELQNGPQQLPELPAKMPEAEKRAERAKRREDRHWRRVVKTDMIDRKNEAEENRLKAIDDKKNQQVREQYVTAGASLIRLLSSLKGVNLPQGELGDALKALDEAWTRGDLEKGKDLKEQLNFRAAEIDKRKNQLDKEDQNLFYYNPDDPENIFGKEFYEGEDNLDNSYTEIDDSYEKGIENEAVKKEAPMEPVNVPPKYYVFQPEYKDAEMQEQDELVNALQGGLNIGGEESKQTGSQQQPPLKEDNKLDIDLRETIKNESSVTTEQISTAQNADKEITGENNIPEEEEQNKLVIEDTHTASWWIKKFRRSENLLPKNPETNQKTFDHKQIAYIMAARELANSVRHKRAKLDSAQLTMSEIKNRAVALSKQPDFSSFISSLKTDPNLRRQAISAAGTGHGGGLDDMFTKYLAQKAPGELPTDEILKRWRPSALQRIEGLQEQLRNGDPDPFTSKKCMAEIIAARKLTGARHAGKFQHADENLNKKLDPKVLNTKTEELEVCLHMLAGAEYEELRSKATDGHGGAMMERFKELNTVAAQKQRVQQGMTTAQLAKVDAATIMATYAEPAASRDLQLEDANAMKVAAELRKRGSYQAFIKQNNGEFVRQNAGELYASFVGFHNNFEAQKNPGQPVNNLIEALDENIERQGTMDILRVNDQELMNQAHN